MNKVRSGVIGLRLAGDVRHIPAVQSHLLAELVAVQSHERAKAEKVACDFRVKHACTTVEEIQVENPWPNRMIGDAVLTAEKRFAWSSWEWFKPNPSLLPSGLLGPVTMLAMQNLPI